MEKYWPCSEEDCAKRNDGGAGKTRCAVKCCPKRHWGEKKVGDNCCDVQAMVINYLEDHGYDGLYASGECGCQISDLAPCGSDAFLYCEPGYKRPANDDEEAEFKFMIGRDKPTKEDLEA